MFHPKMRILSWSIARALPALTALCGPAFAADDKAAVSLPDVTVVETRPPALGETQIDRATLLRLRSTTGDTATLLGNVPGVSLYGAGGVSSLPAIHGLADDRLRIKIDGMDLIASCPNHMNPALSYLDPSNVSALKVYAGIAPVSTGGDSIGGTILAESAAPEFAASGQGRLIKGQLGSYFRSNGNASGVNLSASYATETVSASYTGALSQADNYKAAGDFKTATATGRVGHDLPLDEVGSSAYRTQNHAFGLAFKSANHLIEAKLGVQDLPYQLYPTQRMDMLDNVQHRANLRYQGQFDWGALDARVYRETVKHLMDFGADKRYWYGTLSGAGAACAPISGPPNTCAAGMPMETESSNTGASIKASLALGQQDDLRLGTDLQRYRLDDWWAPSGGGMWPGTFWNIADGKRDRTALFAEWEARRGTQWVTQLGARFERVQTDAGQARGYNTAAGAMGNQVVDANGFNARSHARTDNNWDLAALARYTADATRNIEFGYAHKVRSPNLYERYTWSTWTMAAVMNNFVGDGNGYVGNPDLKPEQADTLSATFDWHATDRSWELKATPYYTRVTDFIDAVRCTSGAACTAANASTSNQFVVLQYANQSARLLGLDLSGRLPLATTTWGEWGLNGLLNLSSGKNRDTGDELYNIMPPNAKLTVTHKLGAWDSGLELVMVKAKDKVSDVRNEVKTPGYGLMNLRASYNWKQARVDVGIDNLLDKFYRLPLGGAYVGQDRTMGINSVPWGVAVAGAGRSLYAGVTVKF
ncbi:MAG: TonB-dependent receptor [Rhodoferax sp.]|nr:TonB-dependent receptor [Rhodoferax sp.]